MTNQKLTSSQDQQVSSNLLFWSIFLKTTALSFVFVGIFLLITAVAIFGIGLKKLHDFERLTGVDKDILFSDVKTGLKQSPKQNQDKVTFLILGTDELSNRGDAQVLTDTMLLATIHLQSGRISLLSIPRDLWSDEYKTKINALYSYGSERYPNEPERFPTEVLTQMIDVPVQHTVVISLETLGDLIDSVEGVTVTVPTGFTDLQFPRTDIDVTVERDPTKLYKTVSFEAGEQNMNGQRALEYIRSRHSQDVEQGSDTARAQRQQLIIQALLSKIINKETLTSTDKVAKLYTLFNTSFSQYISFPEVISLAKALYPYRSSLQFTQNSISIYPEDQNGVIYHPLERNYQNQWVYAIRDQENFKSEIRRKIGYE